MDWMKDKENQDALKLNEAVDTSLVQEVVCNGYAPDLTDDELEELGRDPFLIAYGMASDDRCVVTTEASKRARNDRIEEFLMCATFFPSRAAIRFRSTALWVFTRHGSPDRLQNTALSFTAMLTSPWTTVTVFKAPSRRWPFKFWPRSPRRAIAAASTTQRIRRGRVCSRRRRLFLTNPDHASGAAPSGIR